MIEAGRAQPAHPLPMRPLALAVVVATLAGVVGGIALHRLRAAATPTAFALPELHGQTVWAPGERPAPAFALHDQHGAVVRLHALRSRPVLLTFLGSRCGGACASEGRRISSVLRRLPAADRPTLVIVSLDPRGDTASAIDRAARRWGLAGAWRWHWLTGSPAQLAPVWQTYGVPAGSARRLRILLIDRSGDERTAYLFPFLPSFVQGDLERLAGERT